MSPHRFLKDKGHPTIRFECSSCALTLFGSFIWLSLMSHENEPDLLPIPMQNLQWTMNQRNRRSLQVSRLGREKDKRYRNERTKRNELTSFVYQSEHRSLWLTANHTGFPVTHHTSDTNSQHCSSTKECSAIPIAFLRSVTLCDFDILIFAQDLFFLQGKSMKKEMIPTFFFVQVFEKMKKRHDEFVFLADNRRSNSDIWSKNSILFFLVKSSSSMFTSTGAYHVSIIQRDLIREVIRLRTDIVFANIFRLPFFSCCSSRSIAVDSFFDQSALLRRFFFYVQTRRSGGWQLSVPLNDEDSRFSSAIVSFENQSTFTPSSSSL